MSTPFSLRLDDTTLERLSRRSGRTKLPPRSLAQRYVEEGLRQDEHPLVRFVDGPAGRRAGLIGTGLDVWEVIATAHDNDGDTAATSEYLHLPTHLVEAAVSYYGAFPGEIDEWIEANAAESAEVHAAWLAGQQAIAR